MTLDGAKLLAGVAAGFAGLVVCAYFGARIGGRIDDVIRDEAWALYYSSPAPLDATAPLLAIGMVSTCTHHGATVREFVRMTMYTSTSARTSLAERVAFRFLLSCPSDGRSHDAPDGALPDVLHVQR